MNDTTREAISLLLALDSKLSDPKAKELLASAAKSVEAIHASLVDGQDMSPELAIVQAIAANLDAKSRQDILSELARWSENIIIKSLTIAILSI